MPTRDEPLGVLERRVFGDDATRDETSGRPYEQGHGSLPRDQQAAIFAKEAQLGRTLYQGEAQAVLREQANAAAAAAAEKHRLLAQAEADAAKAAADKLEADRRLRAIEGGAA